jgi:uncharacterized protein YqjF (DUF2071 family)
VDQRFNHAVLRQTAHRPWRLPERPWVMTQTWHDLLFAHWRVKPGALRDKVPRAFQLDLFEGEAWIGIVPFRMTNVAPRGVPPLPWISAFPELNVRTYVHVGGRPGIFFFSLDAGRWLAVAAARALFNLPYYRAEMRVVPQGGRVHYESVRHGADGSAHFRGSYGPEGSPFAADRGSLEYFLTERYCLYHVSRRGRPYRLEIHHPPWSLQAASASVARNTMAEVHGITLADRHPLLHFARRQDMVAWAPVSLAP